MIRIQIDTNLADCDKISLILKSGLLATLKPFTRDQKKFSKKTKRHVYMKICENGLLD